ncbi:MAG TPA: class I SAM-dependent methyltransferase [bacterium]|nr:class I SAM-dependent methyltransferase [bacterium]
MDDQLMWQTFIEIYTDLPQQGPGNDENTLKALAKLPLPPAPHILDVGCGTGRQTLQLAHVTGGTVIAVDNLQSYLFELQAKAKQAGLDERVVVRQGDMNNLPFARNSFDLIWSEGAIYIMGFGNGLQKWRKLLKPGGCLVVTEISWLREDAPLECHRFWQQEYPAMATVKENLRTIRANGYELIDHFTLPEDAWWGPYYLPLEARLNMFREKYAGDKERLQVVEMSQTEIEQYRKYSAYYGYVFYLLRRH